MCWLLLYVVCVCVCAYGVCVITLSITFNKGNYVQAPFVWPQKIQLAPAQFLLFLIKHVLLLVTKVTGQ